jgi:hypothetical protein
VKSRFVRTASRSGELLRKQGEAQKGPEGTGELKAAGVWRGSEQVKTAAQYACDVWHYVAVTLDGRDGTLYVDGIGAGHTLPSSRDLYTFSVETFNTTTRPDFGADSTGVLKLGYVGRPVESRVSSSSSSCNGQGTAPPSRPRASFARRNRQQNDAAAPLAGPRFSSLASLCRAHLPELPCVRKQRNRYLLSGTL